MIHDVHAPMQAQLLANGLEPSWAYLPARQPCLSFGLHHLLHLRGADGVQLVHDGTPDRLYLRGVDGTVTLNFVSALWVFPMCVPYLMARDTYAYAAGGYPGARGPA